MYPELYTGHRPSISSHWNITDILSVCNRAYHQMAHFLVQSDVTCSKKMVDIEMNTVKDYLKVTEKFKTKGGNFWVLLGIIRTAFPVL